jgi:type I restriction enzyme, R subunit
LHRWSAKTFVRNVEVQLVIPGIWTRPTSRSVAAGDIFDVLAFVAYALPTLTRNERADQARVEIHSHFNEKQEGFLDFALEQYVNVGVDELSKEKLTPLLRLKYGDSLSDAIQDLGDPSEINAVFSGFQQYLYQPSDIADAF